MEIQISAKHIEVEDEIKAKAQQLASALGNDFPNQKITSIQILFSSERNWQPVEILVNAKNLSLHAAAKCDQAGASLVKAFDKINTQFARYLDKIQSASVKADPKAKNKIWRSTDFVEKDDDDDLEDFNYALTE